MGAMSCVNVGERRQPGTMTPATATKGRARIRPSIHERAGERRQRMTLIVGLSSGAGQYCPLKMHISLVSADSPNVSSDEESLSIVHDQVIAVPDGKVTGGVYACSTGESHESV